MPVVFVARKGLSKLDGKFDADFWAKSLDNVAEVIGHPDCPRITEGLEVGGAYQFQEEHLFSVAKKGGDFARCMEQLADMVGYHWQMAGADGPGPFRDLFRHPGQFGTIGPVASARLAADFAHWDECARTLGKRSFYAWYTLMRRMFDYAKTDGGVWLQYE
ncbi:hypothetical protein AWB68_05870 [Caballeronia choica]|uniref:Uncharacterized protein n=1 Tax=Caballeronia choica TaxID=326476 RepID=A0A158KHK3_9BURK|nr:hypothetical protein [Caballeronia choica]SAL80495.1 hypothetical protein AWB68_05870 [Caballeronia choica]